MTQSTRLFPEPRLARHACKHHICPDGGYMQASKAMMARTDVPATAKIVYTVALNFLRGSATSINPSMRGLVADSGLPDRTIRHWLTALDRRGFIERRFQRGQTTEIIFADPEDWPPDKIAPNQVNTLRPRQPVATPPRQPVATPPRQPVATPLGNQLPRTPATGCHHSNKNNKEQTTTSKTDVVVDIQNNLDVEDNLISRNAAMLRRIGICGEATIDALANIPGLMPLRLAVLAADAGPDIKNIAGWLRVRLESEVALNAQPPKPKQLCRAIEKGWIAKIDDYEFSQAERQVKWNSDGVHIYEGDELIGTIHADSFAAMDVE